MNALDGTLASIDRPIWTATCPDCGAVRAGAVQLDGRRPAELHARKVCAAGRDGFVIDRRVAGGPGWPVVLSNHAADCAVAK